MSRHTRIWKKCSTLLLLVGLSVMISACSTTTPDPAARAARIEQALQSRDPTGLRGRDRYDYNQKLAELELQEAIARRDPSALKGRQKLAYQREIEAAQQQQKQQQRRQREAKEANRKSAQAKQAREAKRRQQQAENEQARQLEAEQRAKEQALLEQMKRQEEMQRPVHSEWESDMAALQEYFVVNEFEPASRLVDVYAKTMQFLMNTQPSEEQFSEFYAAFSETEKLDHRRMFHNPRGTDLLASFWTRQQEQKAQ